MGGEKDEKCSDQVPFFTSVGLIDTRPAFGALLLGMVLAMVIFLVEHSPTFVRKVKELNHVRSGFEGKFWSRRRKVVEDDLNVERRKEM